MGNGTGSDSDELISPGDRSSSDDMPDSPTSRKARDGDWESDSLKSSERLVDEKVLLQQLNFHAHLPQQWIQDIKNIEIDLETASKYNDIGKPLFFNLSSNYR